MWSRCVSWGRLTILSFKKTDAIVALFPHEVELIAHKSTNMISWLVAETYFLSSPTWCSQASWS